MTPFWGYFWGFFAEGVEMKGVILKGSKYHYERAWPKSVRAIAPTNKFRMALNIYAGAKDSEIARAALVAEEAFDREVAMLSNSDVGAVSDALIEAKASNVMSKMSLADGQLAPNKFVIKTYKGDYPPGWPKDLEIISGEPPIKAKRKKGEKPASTKPKKKSVLYRDGVLWAPEGGEGVSPEMFLEAMRQNEIRQLTSNLTEETEFDRQVKDAVRGKLSSKRKSTPKTLSALWALYCDFKDIKMDTGDSRYRKKLRDWERTLSFVGDHPVTEGIDTEINRGAREFAELMVHENGIKAASAVRVLSMPLAIFRWAADRFELDWRIRDVRLKKTEKKKQRVTATVDQMQRVAVACVEDDDVIACIGILACHGMIPTEIARLEKTTTLDEKIPHIIVPEGKTTERRRVVPIQFGLETLQFNLDACIDYCKSKMSNGGGSATLNQRLTKRILKDDEKQITLYGLRHGCRNLFVMAGASTPILQAYLGWSGHDAGMHLIYGGEGVGSSEFLKTLDEVGKRAMAPLAEATDSR